MQPNGWATMIIRGGYEEFGGSGQGFLALDNHYQPVKTFYASNGYYTDEHELQVLETCVQEYTPDDELIFQWAAWDHLDIRDIQLSNPTGEQMYFSHMNSIDIDDDGHIILSNRELSEVTKIHRQTGEIIWRLGGAHNQFTFINDPLQGPRNQHAARVLGDNVYSLFDTQSMVFYRLPPRHSGDYPIRRIRFRRRGIAYHDDAVKDGDADFRPADKVDVEGTSDSGEGYNIGWTVNGEWLEYTVDVEAGKYNIEYRTASSPGDAVLDVLLDGEKLAQFNVPATGGWQNWRTLVQRGVEIAGGSNLVLRLEIIEGNQNLNWIKFVKTSSDTRKNANVPNKYSFNSRHLQCAGRAGQSFGG